MNNEEAQNEELLVLQSIYEEKYFKVDRMSPPCGRFSAHVQLPETFYVKLKSDKVCSATESHLDSSEAYFEEFEINYLPPINLYFEYPESYPSGSPPAFFVSCCWLSYEQLSKLCKHLDALWKESNGEVILFQWVQFLKEEALIFLDIEESLDITELSNYKLKVDIMNMMPLNVQSFNKKCAISDNGSQDSEETSNCSSSKSSLKTPSLPTAKPSISGGSGPRDCRAFLDIADGKVLKSMLKDYNEFKKAEHFCESWHLCDICFASKLGSEFVTFRVCQHFFCKDCIKSYFELMITEGNVTSLNCPYDKCSTQADGTLVKQVVSKDNFERYDSLLLSRTLDTMSDIAYCPRKACQCPLLIDVSGRIGTCPQCKFVFCPFCKMAYHGIAECNYNPVMREKLYSDYVQGDEHKKKEMETYYGKRVIKSLVENTLSEKWIGSNSKQCPRCNASIEKTVGCNKMTCYRCGTFFCWLCTQKLSTSNPYDHYREKYTDCYRKLFPDDYVDEDDFEDEFEFVPGEFLLL